MKTICLYFQVHQPYRLKNYRFFNIGHDHHYYDDYSNESIVRKVAEKCYLPANQQMLDLIQAYGGRFKICFSITGTALEQFEEFAPEVLESFKMLAKTGSVEFLAETYSHSLASLKSRTEFVRQVNMHDAKIREIFGYEPKVFRNTEFVYSDKIGEIVAEMGYKAMLTEGAKHILGWRSPNYLYHSATDHNLKILLRNFKLSDDIAFRFSNKAWDAWPLTASKFVTWLEAINPDEKIINLFMDYETFGEHQCAETGILAFLRALPGAILSKKGFAFATPVEIVSTNMSVAPLHVPDTISWADEERDLTAWLGNELQDEAFNKLYQLESLVNKIDDKQLLKDWLFLQTSDHFYYMCTKFFSDGDVHRYFNPYQSPYQAFINYMNVLSDFAGRVKEKLSVENPVDLEIDSLGEKEIKALIAKYENNIARLKNKLKPKIIEKSKVRLKAIQKTKAKPIAIDKVKVAAKKIAATKSEAIPIDKAKNSAKPISKTKKQAIPIEKTKNKPKAIDTKKKDLKAIELKKEELKALVPSLENPPEKKKPANKPDDGVSKRKKKK
jgi:alpha-amylase